MTGNDLLTEFDAISLNDFNGVLVGTTAMKLAHLNTSLRRVYEMVCKVAVQTYTHAGGDDVVDLTGLVPRLITVTALRLDDSDVTRVSNFVESGWHGMNEGYLYLQDLPADDYVIEGYVIPSPIVASATTISDVDERLYSPIVKLAVVDALGAHEETAEQANRRATLEQTALTQVLRVSGTQSRSRFNSIFQ